MFVLVDNVMSGILWACFNWKYDQKREKQTKQKTTEKQNILLPYHPI